MRRIVVPICVFALVSLLAYAAITQVKVGDRVYVNLAMQKTSEEVYRIETDIYWPREYFELSAITKANNIQYKDLDTPEDMGGVSMNWVNVHGVSEGNYASYGFDTLKPTSGVTLPAPSVRVFNKKNQLIASRPDAEMEVAIAEREAVVVTFRVSVDSVVDNSVNDLAK